MKRAAALFLMISALFFGFASAQATNVITLNQFNPSAQMSISLPQDSTGVIAISVSRASVQLSDKNNKVVFSSADPRVHLVELSIAPNTGTHLLTVQALPGADSAALQVSAQPDLTPTGVGSDVNVSTIGLQQSETLPLTSTAPSRNTTLTIPPDITGVVTATFPGAAMTTEITDASGTVVAYSSQDIDGFNLVLDGGSYQFAMQAAGLDQPINADVRVMPASQFSLLPAQVISQVPTQVPTQIPTQKPTALTPSCTATITASSVNLRSGPGTEYSVLNFANAGDTFTVVGENSDRSWLSISRDQGSVWVSGALAQLNGDCGSLGVVGAAPGNP